VVALVRVGEMSGTLGATFSTACRELTERKDMQKKVLGALLYPACILVFATALIASIVGFVFPKILPVLQSVKGTLPLPTRVVIFAAHVTTTYGIVIFVVALAVFALLFFGYKKFIAMRRFFERLILGTPFICTLYRAYILSRLLKTLAVLTGAGVGLVDSLEKTVEVTPGVLYGEACANIRADVAGGDQFSSSIARYPRLFPSLCSNLVSVGERTSTFSEVAERIAEIYSGQFKSALDQISKLIEPVIMVLLGCAVGFIAVSIISPIYEITSQVGR
jgi:type IV pilus assembly protein PilC